MDTYGRLWQLYWPDCSRLQHAAVSYVALKLFVSLSVGCGRLVSTAGNYIR